MGGGRSAVNPAGSPGRGAPPPVRPGRPGDRRVGGVLLCWGSCELYSRHCQVLSEWHRNVLASWGLPLPQALECREPRPEPGPRRTDHRRLGRHLAPRFPAARPEGTLRDEAAAAGGGCASVNGGSSGSLSRWPSPLRSSFLHPQRSPGPSSSPSKPRRSSVNRCHRRPLRSTARR